MKSLASRVGVLALLLSPANAAVLLSSPFTGNTLAGPLLETSLGTQTTLVS